MNEEERYLFDIQGYLVVQDVLSKTELAELTRLMRPQYDAEPNNEDIYSQRFGGFLQLESDAFRNLLNHPANYAVSQGTDRRWFSVGSRLRHRDAEGKPRVKLARRRNAVQSVAVLCVPRRGRCTTDSRLFHGR